MHLFYEQGELVDFANYILSDERVERMRTEFDADSSPIPFTQAIKSVTNGDLEFWHVTRTRQLQAQRTGENLLNNVVN